MNMDLSPKSATKKIVDVELGSYYCWSSSLLADANVGGGILSLQPRSYALPHYGDCSKVGYVLQGTGGVTGMTFPGESKEKVVKLSKGDVIPVPIGVVSWWFNHGDTEFVIVFLGETSKGHVPGEYTYFFVTGALNMLNGISDELITRCYNQDSSKLLKSQDGPMLIRVGDGVALPEPTKDKLARSIDEASPDVSANKGCIVTTMGVSKLALFGEVGLSSTLIRLEPNAAYPPVYAADGAVNMIYVARGSGRMQIVGFGGQQVLDSEVKAGEMVVVPRLFVVAKLAGDEGMECFSVITSSRGVLHEIVTKVSMWPALSPQIAGACLKLSPELGKRLEVSGESNARVIPTKT